MSIKLYNGYVIPKFSIEALADFSTSVRKFLQPIAKANYEKLFAKDLFEKLDDISVGANGSDIIFEEGNKSKNIYLALWLSYINRISTMKGKDQRDPEIDFETYVIFLPLKRKILAWFVTEQPELREAWEAQNQVKEYAYYDNVDRPDNISSRQWKKRLADWELAFHGSLDNRISECGLRFNFVSNDIILPPKHENILSYIPEFEFRLNRVAENDYIDKYMINERTKLDLAGLQEGQANYLYRFYIQAKDNIRNGMVDDEIQQAKEKFEPLLIKIFDKEILFEALKIK